MFKKLTLQRLSKLLAYLPLAAVLMHAQTIWAQAPDAVALQQQLQREVDQNRLSQVPAPLVKYAGYFHWGCENEKTQLTC